LNVYNCADFAFYFDMDGVLANYDAGIKARGFVIDPSLKNKLNRSGTGNPLKLEMYKAIQGTDFYAWLPIMEGAIKLWRRCDEFERGIITAAPKFGGTEQNYFLNPHWLGAGYHKRRWMEDLFLPMVQHEALHPKLRHLVRDRIDLADDRFICTTSIQKWKFINRIPAKYQILIDDRIDNCKDWARAGGIAILHGGNADDVIDYISWLTASIEDAVILAEGRGFVMGIDGNPMTFFKPIELQQDAE
jgi:hypothetical protein